VLFLNAILNFNDHKCKLILNALLRLKFMFLATCALLFHIFFFIILFLTRSTLFGGVVIMSFNYLCSDSLFIYEYVSVQFKVTIQLKSQFSEKVISNKYSSKERAVY